MKRKRSKLSYKKERAILSDVLPYELPLVFSNRHFYDFLLENGVEFHNDNFFWKKDDDALDEIMRILIGAGHGASIKTEEKRLFGRKVLVNSLATLKKKCLTTIPFGYRIRHKEDDFRELTICHPRNQLQVVEFYDNYKELILYFCGVSMFSIRKPSRISRFVFHKDKAHYSTVSGEPVGVEEFDREYENLRSFFVYKDYSYVFKFYESSKFHRCEKQYDKLLRLDISKCFDSIYTHSLSWALLKKANVKEYLDPCKSTFPGRFDQLMRNMNYAETNGIIIGPEFSRIFAELILQSVDRAVLLELEHSRLRHQKQYEIFRYVDDYFVFYNDEKTKQAIVKALQSNLKEYKLSLNSAKAEDYEKPIITNISIAKQRIEKLLNEVLVYKIEKVEIPSSAEAGTDTKRTLKTGSIYISAKELITQFKTVIKESAVDYKDTLNYALSIIEGRSAQIIKDYQSISKADDSERQLGQAILAICDFTFFIYSVSPRANTTIRLCRVLQVFISFLKRAGADRDIRHSIFKRIFDNICLILDRDKNFGDTPVETLYLLVALSELGKDYWLDIDTLSSYARMKIATDGSLEPTCPLNYISLMVLLFYVKNKNRYALLRNRIEAFVRDKFKGKNATLLKDTELTLLLLDTLTCPYVSPDTKRELLEAYGVRDPAQQDAIIRKRRYWFIKWTDFDFAKELDAKRSQEVY